MKGHPHVHEHTSAINILESFVVGIGTVSSVTHIFIGTCIIRQELAYPLASVMVVCTGICTLLAHLDRKM